MADVTVPVVETNPVEVRGPTETTTTTPLVLKESEYEEVKTKVKEWSGAMLGLLAVSFLLLIALVILVALIVAKVDPLPDQSLRSFEWFPNEGRTYNSMNAGNMVFALWADGDAYVVNNQTGAIVNMSTGSQGSNPTNSSSITGGTGGYMTLADGEVKIYAHGSNTLIAIAQAAQQNSSSFTLNLLPTGSLFWKSSDGTISAFVWQSPQTT
jgi:hypothetical protein